MNKKLARQYMAQVFQKAQGKPQNQGPKMSINTLIGICIINKKTWYICGPFRIYDLFMHLMLGMRIFSFTKRKSCKNICYQFFPKIGNFNRT